MTPKRFKPSTKKNTTKHQTSISMKAKKSVTAAGGSDHYHINMRDLSSCTGGSTNGVSEAPTVYKINLESALCYDSTSRNVIE